VKVATADRRIVARGVVVATVLVSPVAPFHRSNVGFFQDAVLVSDYSHVTALAASSYTLFAATPHGLVLYDRLGRGWRPPVTWRGPFHPGVARVALADAVDDAVWLGTTLGWARYDARLDGWTSGPVAGGVGDLAIDPQDPAGGVYLRGGTGWSYLPRGGLVPFGGRAPPPGARRPLDVRTALSDAPQADAWRALILTDERLRGFHFTAAARTPDQADLLLGTDGLGVIKVDPLTGQWERLAYGLLAPGAGALAPGGDGVWVASRPRLGEREGLTWVAADLTRTAYIEGRGTAGLGFREGRDLLERDGRLWVATERGIARVDPRSGEVRLVDLIDPLVLAPAPDGVWVGSARGLVVVTDSGAVVPVGPSGPPAVLSLAVAGESLWVGTTAGLAVVPPGAAAPVVPPALAGEAVLRGPIVALALHADTLVAATPDQLAWAAAGRWTVLRPGAPVGRLRTLTPDAAAGVVWVGGSAGVASWRVGAGVFRAARPFDVPAGARDIVVRPPYLWIATDSGVVRLRREAAIAR
jgi:hypothetical protein